jgi:hypothetical protein
LATFSDTDTGGPASDFLATIDWGDGQSSTGTVSGSNGSFTVSASHDYAKVGNYKIGISIADDDAGTATATAGTSVTINQAPLTVTANDASKDYGAPNPALSYMITGFVNNDPASVVSGSASLATTATTTSPAGSYPITIGVGSLNAVNYSFANLVDGTLTVNKAGTTTAENVSAVTPLFGVDTVTFTANVSVVAPGSGSPSGSIDFFDATTSTDLGTVGLSGNTASFTTGSLAVGKHTIQAKYVGDGKFLPSSDSASLQVLQPSALAGFVWNDFNNNGRIDFNEHGVSGVAVALQGTDDLVRVSHFFEGKTA